MENLNESDFTGVNQYRNSIVKTIAFDKGNIGCYGTGFFVSEDKVVTAAHNLQLRDGIYVGNFKIQFSFQQADETVYSKFYTCQVLVLNPKEDIAIGTIKDCQFKPIVKPLCFSVKKLNTNDPISCYGYPTDQNFIKTSGTFSCLKDTSAKDIFGNTLLIKNSLKCDISIDHGNSGSPLIDNDGFVVGMISSSCFKNHTAYAIDIAKILSMLTNIN
jgi:V8-like Glu-specific endopeptidase